MTAYGALQFEDMAKVMPIDDAMLQRTREWLLSRRDEKGGFLRNPRALDSFGRAPEEIVRHGRHFAHVVATQLCHV